MFQDGAATSCAMRARGRRCVNDAHQEVWLNPEDPKALGVTEGPASPSDFSSRVRANLRCCLSRSARPAISLSGLRANVRLGCLRTRDASSGGVATATLRFAAAYRAAIGRVRTARSSKSSALRADSSLSGIPSPIRFTPFPIPLGGPNRYHVGCPEGVFRATSATP